MEDITQINVKLPRELLAAFTRVAESFDRSVSQQIRWEMKQAVERQRRNTEMDARWKAFQDEIGAVDE